jgi:hypothetical protein
MVQETGGIQRQPLKASIGLIFGGWNMVSLLSMLAKGSASLWGWKILSLPSML